MVPKIVTTARLLLLVLVLETRVTMDAGSTAVSVNALNTPRQISYGRLNVSGNLGDMKTIAWIYYQFLYSTDHVSTTVVINEYLYIINFK